VIDKGRVVRLKAALTDPLHAGLRTDVVCSRGLRHRREGADFWLYPKEGREYACEHVADGSRWNQYYRQFGPKKPYTGLCAVFCAVQFEAPTVIGLIGFDFLLAPHLATRWSHVFGHDAAAEHACLYSLGVEIIDLAKESSWPN